MLNNMNQELSSHLMSPGGRVPGGTSVFLLLMIWGVLFGSPLMAQAGGQLTASASSLTFGGDPVYTTKAEWILLKSTGTQAITIKSVAVTGLAFSVSKVSLPVTLNPGSVLALEISFHPLATGTQTGAITVLDSSSTSGKITVNLSGTGTFPRLTPSASTLAFGNVVLKTTSTQTLTLKSSGTAPVKITSVALSGISFTESGRVLPVPMNPGQSITLQVSFNPTVAGAASGAIHIVSTSYASGLIVVSLSGTGTNPTNPVLTMSATGLNFGNDPVGKPVTRPVTLTSTGTSPVTVSAATITGAGFTFSGITFPVTLNPTIAITAQVQFDPSVIGTASGTLKFSSNSTTGSTSTVNLSGVGTTAQHQVSLSWAAPANSPVPVVDYNVYRATRTSSSYQLLNSASTTSYVDLSVSANTTYTYYVTSMGNTGAESIPSNHVTVTVP